MEAKNNSSGYDAPRNKKEDDILGRWRFAEDIFNLAKNTPNDLSVRIGIYGRWGEGKTTVMSFIARMAEKENNIVLWFNPWKYTTDKEMWGSFIIDVYSTLRSAGIELNIRDEAKNLWFRFRRVLAKWISPIEEIGKAINPYVASGITALKSFIVDIDIHLPDVLARLKGRRFFILIDDLDRTDIKLVPQILFALRELLDLPGFTFILSFDPNVVNKAFHHTYSEEEYGRDFLDKIIDFPRWLPTPEEKNLILLAKNEIQKYTPFIDFSYIESLFSFFDKNPRKLKQLIRLFIGFDKELLRYEPWEINWSLFILVNLFKVKYPQLIEPIFTNNIIETGLLDRNFFREEQKPSLYSTSPNNQKEKQADYITEIEVICEKYKLSEKLVDIKTLIQAIFNYDKGYSLENIRQYCYLSERPIIITWKEYNSIFSEYSKNQSEANFIHLLDHKVTNNWNYLKKELLQALFLKAVEGWNWFCSQAADSDFNEPRVSLINDASIALSIIKILSFKLGGFVGDDPFLESSSFHKLFELVTRWITFVTPNDYTELRKQEQGLLVDICSKCSVNLNQMLDSLKPWYILRGDFEIREQKEFLIKLADILENRLTIEIIKQFKTSDWLSGEFLLEDHSVEHYCLLRLASPLWNGDNRNAILNILKTHEKPISDNANRLLNLIGYLYIEKDGYNSIVNADNSIFNDKEIITELWKCALSEEINPRKFSSVKYLYDGIKKKYNYDLPKPKWWERVEKMIMARKHSVESTNTNDKLE